MLPTHYPAHYNAATPLSNDAQAFANAYGGVRKGVALPYSGLRFSISAILMAIFAPWGMFVFMAWAHGFLATGGALQVVLEVLALLAVCFVAYLALKAWMNRHQQGVQEARLLMLIALMSLLSWGVGFDAGDHINRDFVRDHSDLVLLNDYEGVDPTLKTSQMFMDAGRITFTEGSHPDVSKSMSFKSEKMYCAAPIVGPTNSTQGDSYSFWAVGIDCCSAKGANFACGAFSDPKALSGVRVVHSDEQGYYRLAVRQAEEEYNIHVSHPVFYNWVRDPELEIAQMMDDGVRKFFNYLFTWFAWQLFATFICMLLLGWSS